ncbi:hypothetical protein M3J09_013838 [Ascochyta lentis]
MIFSFPPPFQLGDQDITPTIAASKHQEVERKIWLYWIQHGVMPLAFPCGIFFHGGVFDPPLGTEIRIPDEWERCLERTPEQWYDHTSPIEPWQKDPLRSQRAQRREDYVQAMLYNEIDAVRTHWYGNPSPTGGYFRVGRPSPPRGGHNRQPSYYGAHQSPPTPATPSTLNKSKSRRTDRESPSQNAIGSIGPPEAGSPRVSRGDFSSFPVNLFGRRKTQSMSQSQTGSVLGRSSPGSFDASVRTPTKIPAPTVSSTFESQRGEQSSKTTLSPSAVASSPATNISPYPATPQSSLSLRQRRKTLMICNSPTANTEPDSAPYSPTPAPRKRYPRIFGYVQNDFKDEIISPSGGGCSSDTSSNFSHDAKEAVDVSGGISDNTGTGGSNIRDNADPNPSELNSGDHSVVESSVLGPESELVSQHKQGQSPRLRSLIDYEYSEAWSSAFARPWPRDGGRE